MATLDQLHDPDEIALAAKHVPPDILSRLSAAELRYRVRHAKHVADRAKEASLPESRQSLNNHAVKLLSSEPAVDHIHEKMRRQALANGAPAHLWGAYYDVIRTHKEAHAYPSGLLAACNQALEGRPVVGDPELAATADACVSHYSRTADKR
jgi:hypothetical protein